MTDPRLTLEKRIDAELCGLDADFCLYADDLRGHTVLRGGDEPFESASTIKIYVLGCLYARAAAGKASLDAPLTYRAEDYVDGSGMIRALGVGAVLRAKDAATLMIICSDNIATNMLIAYLGLAEINEFIKSIGCTGTTLHRALRSDTWGEPLGTITPRDMGRFFVLLAKGALVSPEASAEMRQIFRQQHYNTMLAGNLPPYYTDAEESGADEDMIYTASKSGSMDACRNDGGLVHTPYGDYVLVMLCKNFANKLEVTDHPAMVYGGKVSRLLFDQYLALEGSFVLGE
ncbi:MAG: class A beta-lactamase-related serine hydrolase [Gemmiger sp.]|nr:class A beta-lactamase-related serine hydrolase [Gemmiger sp.]